MAHDPAAPQATRVCTRCRRPPQHCTCTFGPQPVPTLRIKDAASFTGWNAQPLQAGSATFPRIIAAPVAPRSQRGPRRHLVPFHVESLAAHHEDVARGIGWPQGWCE